MSNAIIEKDDIRIFATEELLDSIQNSLLQAQQVAQLPGRVGKVLLMPDAHQGYGIPIGGVVAFENIVSPGGVGFDINCGVRAMATSLTKDELEPHIDAILDDVFTQIPVGKGQEGKHRLTHEELDVVLEKGMLWAKDKGFATQDDVDKTENYGQMTADATKVSPTAKKRGKNQIGTLGAGNHFVEFQIVDEIFDSDVARTFGITQKNQIIIMIHSGSRGLGHQTCSDYLRKMEDEHPQIFESLPEKDLMYAPVDSATGSEYLLAMGCAANFAWVNRFMMAYEVGQVLKKHFPNCSYTSIYDVTHNICKKETYDGKQVYVHRKGATRAFPAGNNEVCEQYRSVGHPVLIPGSMGTPSYILVGTQRGMDIAFGSTAHGSGRVMGRKVASQTFDSEKEVSHLQSSGIHIKAPRMDRLADEVPGVYKNSEDVVNVSELSGIGKRIVKLKPFGVIKG